MDTRRLNSTASLATRPLARRSLALGLAAGAVGAIAGGRTATAQESTPASDAMGGPGPSPRLLSPDNSALVLVDYQPGVALLVQTMDLQLLINNVAAITEAAAVFNVPTVLSTVGATFNRDPLLAEIQAVYPDQQPIDRSGLNAWEDPAFVAAVEATGRRKLIIGGLYTEICLTLVSLSAIAAGYEVYALVDVVGGLSHTAHDAAIQRLIQAGVTPVTWMAVMSEWQRDWTRTETAGLFQVAAAHGGAYALQAQLAAARGGN
ncbi:MAG: isochorismatase family protein [Chloroflexota bacterium]|nr:isochorismatase family protein [Chloroflexota bacterium]